MNTSYKSNILTKRCWKILTAVCLSAFLFVTATFAQTPTLRANGKIAFTSDRDGNQEIYVMNNDGTGQVRLTNNNDVNSLPAFSPDGMKIAFVSQQTSGALTANIKMMNADGTNQTELTSIGCCQSQFPYLDYESLSWSPDGSKIALQDNGEIFTINVDGSNRTNLTNHPAGDSAPAWSPDGLRILFTSNRLPSSSIMHTMNADGSDVRALPSEGDFNDLVPDWSPTGNKIVFVYDSQDFGTGLYTANADGTNRQFFAGSAYKPKWSPDATKIVFHSLDFVGNDSEIYVKNVDGSGLTQLTNTIGRNFQPSWQPLTAVKSRKRIRFF